MLAIEHSGSVQQGGRRIAALQSFGDRPQPTHHRGARYATRGPRRPVPIPGCRLTKRPSARRAVGSDRQPTETLAGRKPCSAQVVTRLEFQSQPIRVVQRSPESKVETATRRYGAVDLGLCTGDDAVQWCRVGVELLRRSLAILRDLSGPHSEKYSHARSFTQHRGDIRRWYAIAVCQAAQQRRQGTRCNRCHVVGVGMQCDRVGVSCGEHDLDQASQMLQLSREGTRCSAACSGSAALMRAFLPFKP